MKAFIDSQFGYCPLIWMFNNKTLDSKMNRLHNKALRLVYKDTCLTFEELLQKDNSFKIHNRNLQKLAIEMYKVVNGIAPAMMNCIFPQRTITYDLRNSNPFKTFNVKGVFNGTETI